VAEQGSPPPRSGRLPTAGRRDDSAATGRHYWDEPAETLLELAPAHGAHLVMPRLGEPVEPSRVEAVTPWWRAAAATDGSPRPAPVEEEPPSLAPAAEGSDAVAWPID